MKVLLATGIFFAALGALAAPVGAASLVNINTADKAELMTLTGIGEVKAQAIIDYRDANGPFKTKEEIKNVSGIGDATYEKLEAYITVGESSQTQVQSVQEEKEDAATNSAASESTSPSPSPTSLHIVGKSTVVAGAEVEFEAIASGVRDGAFKWNFGDGTTGEGRVIDHTFAYPGKYAVTLSVVQQDDDRQTRLTVEAIALPLSLLVQADRALSIVNRSKQEVDVGRWSLLQGNTTFVIPKETFVLGGETLTFSQETTGLHEPSAAILRFPSGMIATSATVTLIQTSASQNTATKFVAAKSAVSGSPASRVDTSAQGASPAMAALGGLPLWGYGAALGVLVVAGAGATFFFSPAPAAKRPEDEFEISD